MDTYTPSLTDYAHAAAESAYMNGQGVPTINAATTATLTKLPEDWSEPVT